MTTSGVASATTSIFELTAALGQRPFPRLSQLRVNAPDWNYPARVPISSSKTGFSILDVIFAHDGTIRLIEASGSNANFTSVPLGQDELRVRHMITRFSEIADPEEPNIILFPFGRKMVHFPEYFARLLDFVRYLENHTTVRIASASEGPITFGTTIVCDYVEEIADHLSLRFGHLMFKGRPVNFATNCNLISHLLRVGKIRSSDIANVCKCFHDGALIAVFLDKAKQQELCGNTGIDRLQSWEAYSQAEALMVLRLLRSHGIIAVGKINGGSGGIGIEFFSPAHRWSTTVLKLRRMHRDAVATYGAEANVAMYPVRFFEFAQSTPASLRDGAHLWDMRIACFAMRGIAEVFPCLVRICPKPFSGRFLRDSVVSNLTGRGSSLEYTRQCDDALFLDAASVNADRLAAACVAAAKWCDAAMEKSLVE